MSINSTSNNFHLGYGLYTGSIGVTSIYGNDIKLYTRGHASLVASSISRTQGNPSSTLYSPGFQIIDKNASRIGLVRTQLETNGEMVTYIGALRANSSGTEVGNWFGIGIDRSGNRKYHLSDVSAFRDILKLNNFIAVVSATSGKFSINSGQTYSREVTVSLPSGFELVGCIGFNTSHNQAAYVGSARRTDSNKITVSGKNTSSNDFNDMTVTVVGLAVYGSFS